MKPTHLRPNSAGFTLVELLIVIGIVAILISIIIPTVARVKEQAANAVTRQMLTRIETGLQEYYSAHHSYPGPFYTVDLKPYATGAHALGATTMTGPLVSRVTTSENLYLAMVGGLYATTGPATFTFDPSRALNGTGAFNLQVTDLKKYAPYIVVEQRETTAIAGQNISQPGNPAGVWSQGAFTAPFVGDTIVPEILDRYPRPSPIIYLRASKGGTGMDVDDATVAYNGAVQYQLEQATLTYSGSAQAQNQKWAVDTNSYKAVSGTTLAAGGEAYLGNKTLSTTADVPQKKDEFILISAGYDGVYGTADDITNFR